MKICTKCGESKPLSEFNQNSKTRDGLICWCKACARIALAKWKAANPEKVKAAHVKYLSKNLEKNRRKCAAYAASHREQSRAKAAAWRAANPEKSKEGRAAYAAANPEKIRANKARWKVLNPESVIINEHIRRARKAGVGGKLSPGLAEKLFKLQRGKCACCKKPLGKDFHRDHRMPLALGGSNTDDNIQLLCPTCNLQKNAKHPIDFMQQKGFLL